MANLGEIANIFANQNMEEQENIVWKRRLITNENQVDPFTLSDQSFVKNFRLTKNLNYEIKTKYNT